jgi:hypothetical protein
MTHEWKPGDKAMVEIGYVTPNGKSVELCYEGKETAYAISSSLLFHLPPSITPEAQAVLDAADAIESANGLVIFESNLQYPFVRAVVAYRASITPPDPIKIAIKKLRAAYRDMDDICFEDAIAAIAAYEEPSK